MNVRQPAAGCICKILRYAEHDDGSWEWVEHREPHGFCWDKCWPYDKAVTLFAALKEAGGDYGIRLVDVATHQILQQWEH